MGPVVVASGPQTDGDGPAGSAVFTDVIVVILRYAGYLVRSKRRRAEIKRESLGVRDLFRSWWYGVLSPSFDQVQASERLSAWSFN